MTLPYAYQVRSRTPGAMAIVVAVYGSIGAGLAVIDMSPWVATFFAALALPALINVLRNDTALLDISGTALAWRTRSRAADFPNRTIELVRLARRMDGGLRIAVIDTAGQVHKLPPMLSPPLEEVEAALNAAGIAHERAPFSLLPPAGFHGNTPGLR